MDSARALRHCSRRDVLSTYLASPLPQLHDSHTPVASPPLARPKALILKRLPRSPVAASPITSSGRTTNPPPSLATSTSCPASTLNCTTARDAGSPTSLPQASTSQLLPTTCGTQSEARARARPSSRVSSHLSTMSCLRRASRHSGSSTHGCMQTRTHSRM